MGCGGATGVFYYSAMPLKGTLRPLRESHVPMSLSIRPVPEQHGVKSGSEQNPREPRILKPCLLQLPVDNVCLWCKS